MTEAETHFHLKWSGLTDKGRFRRNNEDAFLALMFDDGEVRYLGKEGESSTREGDFIFAVSDGMGGANSGEFASRIAVQKITQWLPRYFSRRTGEDFVLLENALSEILVRTHAEMIEMGRHYEECNGMGATLSLVWITPGAFIFGHVGDSRIYQLPAEGEMKQITQDHSRVGSLQRKGELNEREARIHPERHVLDQALGGKQKQLQPQLDRLAYAEGDTLVLCTDGITDGVWDRGIENLIRNPPPRFDGLNPARRLVREAFEESGRDNITALVVELEKEKASTAG